MLRYLLFSLLFLQPSLHAQSTASASVTTFEIEASQLQTKKKIWVYLPRDYAQSKQKYPVLYLHDGQNLFDAQTSYVGEWGIDETLDSLHAKVIVIGIAHGNEKRLEELTPYPHPKYGGSKADAYLDFVVATLKPYIDQNYRTKTNRKNTFIGGSSLGGLVSFYAVLKYPKVFQGAMVFSPAFWISEPTYALAMATDEVRAKLYFLCGDAESEDILPDMQRMEQILKAKPRFKSEDLQQKVVIGGKHNEKLWRAHFANAYLWLFK